MRSSRGFWTAGRAAALAGASLALCPTSALADEPRNATEPRVMQEPGEVVNVIDSFDDGDLFDLNISLGFEYFNKSAKIFRETSIFEPGLTTGGFTSKRLNVASYSETTSRLIPRVDVGIYKDIAAHISLPIILANSRTLSDLSGSGAAGSAALAGAPGERLFGFEGRFSVGTPMHACNPKPGQYTDKDGNKQQQIECADPSDVNRSGTSDSPFDGAGIGKRTAGVTRGTVALEVHTMMSKRIKYIEPYGGFTALFEFQQSSSDYGVTDVDATLVNHPPLVGTMTLGMMIIPWENREKFGRLTFDLRFSGQYHSEGRDYSELFDALGSSSASSLRSPQWSRYKANPDFSESACRDNDPATACFPRSVVDEASQKTYFTGLTDVQAYGSYRASASVTWQAGEYVKFQFGMGYRHDQGHGITQDQPCNPSFKDDAGAIQKAGPCHSGDDAQGQTISATGVPNPNYRPTVNAVGRRFFVDGSNTFDIFASGVVMF